MDVAAGAGAGSFFLLHEIETNKIGIIIRRIDLIIGIYLVLRIVIKF
jgi:hypothetical protein